MQILLAAFSVLFQLLVPSTGKPQLRQHYGKKASMGRQPTTQPKPLKDGLPLPGSLRWWFHLSPERLSAKQRTQLTLLCESNAELARTYQLAQEFTKLLRGRKEEELSGWLKKVYESEIIELVSFAKGLERDEDAVRAGLHLPWSQGPVEGAVNRLKLIKRSMYDIVGELEVTPMIQSPYQEASAC